MSPSLALSDASVLLVAAVVSLLIVRLLQSRNRLPLPPGPKPLPILENLFDIPKSFSWLTYAQWGDVYGPLVFVSAMGNKILIANSYGKAIELLDKKSSIYSSRKLLTMPVNVLGWGKTMGMLEYGPRYRAYRKILQRELGTMATVQKYAAYQESQTVSFLKLCLESPQDLHDHCFQYSGALILRIVYGYKAKDHDDAFIRASTRYMDAFSQAASPNKFIVNYFPILRFVQGWIPGFKEIIREWKPLYDDHNDIPFKFVKEQMAAGLAEKSFVASALEQKLSDEDEDILKHAVGGLFGGGTETTASAIYAFFLFMCLYPQAQKQAQDELDRVVGRGNLPTLNDRANLPYLEALSQEIMRFHPVGPCGLPHYSTESDIHDGYFIPEGTVVIPNIWMMTRDPKVYTNPHVFNPDRFLGPNPEQNPREYVFGFGRRICPGRVLAETTFFTVFAMCISALNISPGKRDGVDYLPQYKPGDGIVSQLEPFECNISLRYPEGLEVIANYSL